MSRRWMFPYDYPFGPNVDVRLNATVFALSVVTLVFTTLFILGV